mmetsp:Transcript_47761/g.126402  ORF Transcript_47761/g.126402 Transcript_47761/m.126402 type:complete len:542 (-) Transcript_47761:187-1812(-)
MVRSTELCDAFRWAAWSSTSRTILLYEAAISLAMAASPFLRSFPSFSSAAFLAAASVVRSFSNASLVATRLAAFCLSTAARLLASTSSSLPRLLARPLMELSSRWPIAALFKAKALSAACLASASATTAAFMPLALDLIASEIVWSPVFRAAVSAENCLSAFRARALMSLVNEARSRAPRAFSSAERVLAPSWSPFFLAAASSTRPALNSLRPVEIWSWVFVSPALRAAASCMSLEVSWVSNTFAAVAVFSPRFALALASRMAEVRPRSPKIRFWEAASRVVTAPRSFLNPRMRSSPARATAASRVLVAFVSAAFRVFISFSMAALNSDRRWSSVAFSLESPLRLDRISERSAVACRPTCLPRASWNAVFRRLKEESSTFCRFTSMSANIFFSRACFFLSRLLMLVIRFFCRSRSSLARADLTRPSRTLLKWVSATLILRSFSSRSLAISRTRRLSFCRLLEVSAVRAVESSVPVPCTASWTPRISPSSAVSRLASASEVFTMAFSRLASVALRWAASALSAAGVGSSTALPESPWLHSAR